MDSPSVLGLEINTWAAPSRNSLINSSRSCLGVSPYTRIVFNPFSSRYLFILCIVPTNIPQTSTFLPSDTKSVINFIPRSNLGVSISSSENCL